MSPPISAWEELVGRPKNHVMRSQDMAPMRAPRMTYAFMAVGEMIPEPMVLATAKPKTRNATKLKVAARPTAAGGDRALVDTTVDIEFAASWKPLTKSKAKATTIIPMTRVVNNSDSAS